MRVNFFCSAIALLALTACNSNPYPAQGQMTKQAIRQNPHDPIYGVEVDDPLVFEEGKAGQFNVIGHVPAPGNAIVSFDGLPPGAKYNPAKSVLEWQPDYNAANDPADPTAKEKNYRVTIFVGNSASPGSTTSRVITLKVKDTPREFKVAGLGKPLTVYEGQKLHEAFTINNEDFPKGPYRVVADGLPDGATLRIDPKNPNQMVLDYAPNFRVVSLLSSARETTRLFKFSVSIYDPRGHKLDETGNLSVADSRQRPVLSAPPTVTQGLDVSFVVTAEDLNAEVVPQTLLTAVPNFGNWNIQELESFPGSDIRNPSKSYVVTGKNIPISANGTRSNLRLQSCTIESYTTGFPQMSNCIAKDIQVQIQTTVHDVPVIDRSFWTFGTTKSFRVGENLNVELPVRDANGSSAPPTVSVKTNGPGLEANWISGRMTLHALKAGLYRVEVVATSEHGMTASETFAVEVVSTQTPAYLSVGESVRNDEFLKMKFVTDDVQLINPDLQPVDERILKGRYGIVVGTYSFAADSLIRGIENLGSNLPKVFVASPLVARLSGGLDREMKDVGLTMNGPRLKLPCGDQCGDLDGNLIWVGPSGLKPKGGLTLNGKLTSESSEIQPLNIDGKVKKCIPLLTMNDAPKAGTSYTLAARCERANGGTLIVSGFEWADIKTSVTEDLTLPASWFKELTK